MLLDPLADKLMVTTAFILLVAYNPHVMKPWIAVLVIGREFLVSGLRSIASSEGFTIEASELGKLKTVVQIVAIVASDPQPPLGLLVLRLVPHRRPADRRHRDLLDDDRLDHLRGGLLRRLLEEDRPRLRPATVAAAPS